MPMNPSPQTKLRGDAPDCHTLRTVTYIQWTVTFAPYRMYLRTAPTVSDFSPERSARERKLGPLVHRAPYATERCIASMGLVGWWDGGIVG